MSGPCGQSMPATLNPISGLKTVYSYVTHLKFNNYCQISNELPLLRNIIIYFN